MMLERNQLVIGIVVAVLVGIGTVFAVFATGGAFQSGFPMTAEFADAAGLKKGDFVFVAGVRSGRVTGVEIDGDHVVASFALDSEHVPDDSTAAIILANALGKRAIAIEPGTSADVFVEDDTIPLDRTSTPIDFPELGDETVRLLEDSNVEALQDLTTAVADVLEGKREDVADIIDGVDRLTEVLADRREELAQVIVRTEDVVDAVAQKDDEIIRVIDSLGVVLDTLVERRNDISRLLAETANATGLTADLLEERDAQIDVVLDRLHDDVLEVVDQHQVDVAHVFPYLAIGLEGFASIGYSGGDAKLDNPSWGNVFTTDLGQVGQTALLGCGGVIDQFLNDVVGPDPACEGGNNRISGAPDGPSARPTGAGFDDSLPRTTFTSFHALFGVTGRDA